MLDLEEILNIRQMYYRQKMTISEICISCEKDYKTVRKYLDMTDFNEKPSVHKERPSKLDPWKGIIVQWLRADISMPPKQRHTGWRVYQRLMDEYEGFDCSYETVNRFVQSVRNQMNLKKKDPMIPLDHSPCGIAQGDFGTVWFTEKGIRYKGHEFVLSFPHSTAMFSVLSYGENTECLLESLDLIFRFIGGVPPEIWFDNASSMVKKVIKGKSRILRERFDRFCLHYKFCPVFMNQGKGNEKGSGENAVGTLRRNLYVPMPEFDDLLSYNWMMLGKCKDRIQAKNHYISQTEVSELFIEDTAALLPLPQTPLDLSTLMSYTANETGMITIDKGHMYSTSPDLARQSVNVRLTSSYVIVLKDDRKTELVRHRRLYDEENKISIQWGPYLRAMSRKPRSFLSSGFRELLPDELTLYLTEISNRERGQILTVMADLYDERDFEAVKALCLRAAVTGVYDPESFRRLSIQMFGGISEQNYDSCSRDADLDELDKVLKMLVNKKERT